ncbi:MAG: paraquat-inducible protein A [Pseudomonadales bacterium]
MNGLIACQGCDLLIDVSDIPPGARAVCPRCGHFLTSLQPNAMSLVLAYSVAAAIFLLIANSFSFMSLGAGGLHTEMTLPTTVWELFHYGMPVLAILVAGFIILLPAAVLFFLIYIATALQLQRPYTSLRFVAVLFFTIYSWTMVEVFIIGVIVSLIKLSAMATITLGISFWAYVAFSVSFTLALASVDRYQCWQMINGLDAR